MVTEADYAAGTAAALALEKKIIQEKGVPSFMVPSDADLTGYAERVARAVLDAVSTERAAPLAPAPESASE